MFCTAWSEEGKKSALNCALSCLKQINAQQQDKDGKMCVYSIFPTSETYRHIKVMS
jgi:hypothetical protein